VNFTFEKLRTLENSFMKKLLVRAAVALGGLLFSGLALAQGDAGAASASLVPIGAGLAIGLAAFGAASAQGRAAEAVFNGISRNPSAKDGMFQPFILSLVFMEFQALLGFVIAIIWSFK
jgi:F-type H+-transporting ATPase subunit c